MTFLTPTYWAAGGYWTRKGHPSVAPPNAPPPPAGYDWTTNPYGSVYDSRDSSHRAAGGYVPNKTAGTAGIPTGTTLDAPTTGTGGYLTHTTGTLKSSTVTVSATTDKVTWTNHGLSNGHPIFFTSLTGGAGLALLSADPDVNWYVVANATTNDFSLVKFDPLTGLPAAVNITTSYTSANISAGIWYDKDDFTCVVTTSTTVSGVLLFTRSKIEGPVTQDTTYAARPGLLYNASPNLTMIVVDSDLVPQTPAYELNSSYGYNIWGLRNYNARGTDGHGSKGGTHMFGNHFGKVAWFYPDPAHTNGTHNDVGMQVHLGDTHIFVGNMVDAFVDTAVSSTTDSTNFPIPTYPTSAVLVGGGSPLPSNLYVAENDLRGGTTAVNIGGVDSPSLGQVIRNLVHKFDSMKSSTTSNIQAPSFGSGTGHTIHCNIPSSGADANLDETGAVAPPYVLAGNTLVWP